MPATKIPAHSKGSVQRVLINENYDQGITDLQQQYGLAKTTSGSAPNFTLTLDQAPAAYAEPFECEAEFHADGAVGTNNMSINGLGQLPLKQLDANGSRVDAIIKANMISKIRLSGTDLLLLNPLPPSNGQPVPTTGTAPNFNASASSVVSNAAGQRITVKWSANASSPVTLNVNGFGAMTVRRFSSRGPLQDCPVAVDVVTELVSDGTYWTALTDITAKNDGPTVGFAASCTGASANITMSCSRITVRSLAGVHLELTNLSETLNTDGSGVNGLDTGTLAASTWYYMFIIYNPSTNTTDSLCSLSDTNPTLPNGYTHFKRVGAFRTNSTVNKYPFKMVWFGNRAQYMPAAGLAYTEWPSIASGALGTPSSTTPTWSAVSVSNFVPPTANAIDILLRTGGGYTSQAAPDTTYTRAYISDPNGGGITSSRVALMPLVGSTIAVALGVSTGAFAAGWQDSV